MRYKDINNDEWIEFISGSGTNQYITHGSLHTINSSDTWILPSGMVYSGDVYEFPVINQLMKDDNIIKYFCSRCGSKLLVNKEKLPAIQALNCPNCGSSDLEEIK